MLDRLFHQLESAVISVLEPVLLGIHELGPGLISQPVVLHLAECYVEPLDGAWCFGGLVLDEVEPGLDLFPVGCFSFLPDPSCFCWDQWLVLGSEVGGCSSLGCPWVLLEQVLLCDGNPVGQAPGSFVWWAFIEHQILNLGDIRAPSSKPDVRNVGQGRESPELVILPEIIFKLESIRDQAVWSPWYGPFGRH